MDETAVTPDTEPTDDCHETGPTLRRRPFLHGLAVWPFAAVPRRPRPALDAPPVFLDSDGVSPEGRRRVESTVKTLQDEFNEEIRRARARAVERRGDERFPLEQVAFLVTAAAASCPHGRDAKAYSDYAWYRHDPASGRWAPIPADRRLYSGSTAIAPPRLGLRLSEANPVEIHAKAVAHLNYVRKADGRWEAEPWRVPTPPTEVPGTPPTEVPGIDIRTEARETDPQEAVAAAIGLVGRFGGRRKLFSAADPPVRLRVSRDGDGAGEDGSDGDGSDGDGADQRRVDHGGRTMTTTTTDGLAVHHDEVDLLPALEQVATEPPVAGPGEERLVASVAVTPDLLPGVDDVLRLDLGHNFLLLGGTGDVGPTPLSFSVPAGDPNGPDRVVVDDTAVPGVADETATGLSHALAEIRRETPADVPLAPADGTGPTRRLTVVGASLRLSREGAGEDGSVAHTFEYGGERYDVAVVAPEGAQPGYVPEVEGVRTVADGSTLGTTGDPSAAQALAPTPDGPEVTVDVVVRGSLLDAANRSLADASSPLARRLASASPGDQVAVEGWYLQQRADQSVAVDSGWVTPGQMTYLVDRYNAQSGSLPGFVRGQVRNGWVNVRFEDEREEQVYAARLDRGRVVEVGRAERPRGWLDLHVELGAANDVLASDRPGRVAGRAYEAGQIRPVGRGFLGGLRVGLLRSAYGLARGLGLT